MYEKLMLDETRGAASEAEAAEMLARKALEVGIEQFVEKDLLESFLVRCAFAGLEMPDVDATLRELCVGLESFGDLRSAAKDFMPLLESKVDRSLLEEIAPSMMKLKKGRPIKIHYEQGRPPWVSARLQDFFGMKDTLKIGPGKVPVVAHLLAPNQRALQTTTDLAGFWAKLYPEVRPGLARKYPKHHWPEKP
jgi:ATP-dependent helicase HrpB